ncbi:MAG: chemotaxis protein CheX [bacterium]
MSIELQDIRTSFIEAITETFENMAFMEVMLATEEDEDVKPEAMFFTRIPVYKPIQSMLGFMLSAEIAKSISQSILGRDIDIEEDEFEIMDVLNELSNIMAGALLTRLLPDEESFELGLPESRWIAQGEAGCDWTPEQEYHFRTDGQSIWGIWKS